MNSAGTIAAVFSKSKRKESKVYLGKIQGSFFGKEYLTESELNHHVHIVGASGFGKTVLLSHIIRQRIEQGKGLLFIDLKGDIETITKFKSYAAAVDRENDVSIFSLGHKDISSTYNLIGNGSATEIRDRIMLSLNWSEEFYKNQAASFLLRLLIGLCWLRDNRSETLDLSTLYRCLSRQEAIEEACLRVPESERFARENLEGVATSARSSDYWNSLQGLRTQLESMVLSDFGPLLATSERAIDMFKVVQNSGIVFIFLDTRRYGETAKQVGKFILQELKSVSAKVDAEVPKELRKPFSVIIDEFADLAQEDFISFLDRARSSRMSIVVAHQELCDLDRISPEFAGRLMGNTSTVYAFLQKRAESAEILSGIAGTRSVKKTTERYSRQFFLNIPSGETSVRETEEFVIHPNVIKSLNVGTCVCIKKYPISRAFVVNVALDTVDAKSAEAGNRPKVRLKLTPRI